MSTHTLPSARTAKDQLLLLLATLEPNLHVFDGQVDDNDLTFDPDGGAHPYAVLYAGAGMPQSGRLCRTPDSKFFPFQITAAGGSTDRALWAADLVNGVIAGARLSLPDGMSTPISSDEGNLGPVQIDRAVAPVRFWIPLLFTSRLSNS